MVARLQLDRKQRAKNSDMKDPPHRPGNAYGKMQSCSCELGGGDPRFVQHASSTPKTLPLIFFPTSCFYIPYHLML